MGGGLNAVLMFGPKVEYEISEWMEKFNLNDKKKIINLIDKKKWVENFMINDGYEIPDDKEIINNIFEQEFNKYNFFNIIDNFLEKHSMLCVFSNNMCLDYPMIGIKVNDFYEFEKSQKFKDIKIFCKLYSLPEPTFYSGLCGEFD